MRTRLMLVVAAVLLAFGAGSAGARSGIQSAPERGTSAESQQSGDNGGPKSGECEDGLDNDEDGLTDEDDPACQQPGCLPSSQTPQKCDEATVSPENPDAGNCDDGEDNDGDGLIDGDDPDCGTTPPPPPPHSGNCANGADDDGDGDIDHADSDCQAEGCVVNGVNTCDEVTPPLPETETSCDNLIDDDGDGLVDGDDPDCAGPSEKCVAAAGDAGLLTEDTLGQTLWDSGLQIPPLTENPERNGALTGPLGDALQDTPIEVVGDEATCAGDLPIDENVAPGDL